MSRKTREIPASQRPYWRDDPTYYAVTAPEYEAHMRRVKRKRTAPGRRSSRSRLMTTDLTYEARI